jgi:hypothetical protein
MCIRQLKFSALSILNMQTAIISNILPYAIFYAVSTRGIAFSSSSYHKIVWTYIYIYGHEHVK